jgi:hypothetical protein
VTDWDFKRRELEGNIEEQVCAWAENNGWLVRKMTYVGRRGCPDRFFFGFGKVVIIEFKKPGEMLDAHQRKEHARLETAGVHPHVHCTFDGAIWTLRGYM